MAGVQQSVLDEFRVKRKASEPGSKSRRVDKVRLQLSHVHVDFRNSPAKLVQLAANVNDKDSVGARCVVELCYPGPESFRCGALDLCNVLDCHHKIRRLYRLRNRIVEGWNRADGDFAALRRRLGVEKGDEVCQLNIAVMGERRHHRLVTRQKFLPAFISRFNDCLWISDEVSQPVG